MGEAHFRNWWGKPHHDRPGGVRESNATAWVPKSKPIWLTEIGCPAVDLGANQPNVFFDPVSSESALPYYSRGLRDDLMQRSVLEAQLSYWSNSNLNPKGPNGVRAIENSGTHVWTWDARPWPDYPQRVEVWSDGPKHRLGHWITGRLGGSQLSAIVAEICARAGVTDIDVDGLDAFLAGYIEERTQTGRAALQPLMLAFGFDAVESAGRIRFVPKDASAKHLIDEDKLAEADGADSGSAS